MIGFFYLLLGRIERNLAKASENEARLAERNAIIEEDLDAARSVQGYLLPGKAEVTDDITLLALECAKAESFSYSIAAEELNIGALCDDISE